MDFDVLVVGCGFAGAVIARKLAEESHKKVLVIEKRGHIAGNAYDVFNENDILIHLYGPHIFHTNHTGVYDYLSRFTDWFRYEHKVLGKIDGKLVPIPFNFTSLETLFQPQQARVIKEKLLGAFGNASRISVLDLLNSSDDDIRRFGQYVYDKVFVHYTAKQWGVHPNNVDRSVINRVPVVLGYDDRYFSDKHQFMPKLGYYRMFRNLLDYPGITVRLNCDANEMFTFDSEKHQACFDGEPVNFPVIFTGAVDSLLKYQFGELPYRSLDMVFENYNLDNFQSGAVVNYPNEEDFTRITEFKYLTGQKIKEKTTIMKEYPIQYDPKAQADKTPYYPVNNPDSMELYNRYREELGKYGSFYLCGRLAEYKYYNMDAVVARAFGLYDEIKENI